VGRLHPHAITGGPSMAAYPWMAVVLGGWGGDGSPGPQFRTQPAPKAAQTGGISEMRAKFIKSVK
jgi:hypothetical protein